MKGYLLPVLLLAVVSAALAESASEEDIEEEVVFSFDCPKDCEEARCPKQVSECVWGLVKDPCGCCKEGLCAVAEGELCSRPELNLFVDKGYGICGTNMKCVIRPDLKPEDRPEAICLCSENKLVCGTDGKNYKSICALNIAAVESNSTTLQFDYEGPCKAVPYMVNGPIDTSVRFGQNVILDCEVRGNPIPDIVWSFVGLDGKTTGLPNGDIDVAVQSRGGPEPHMGTSWVQIAGLSERHQGVYTCIASNGKGTVTGEATVKAVETEL